MMQPSQGISPAAPRILLLAAEPASGLVARALSERLQAVVSLPGGQSECQDLLMREVFSLVLMEESVGLNQPTFRTTLEDAAGGTMVLELNFGLLSVERVVDQVRLALSRQARLESNALAKVMLTLRNELGASLSGLLLESQLALRTAGPELAPSLQHMVTLAEALSRQLRA